MKWILLPLVLMGACATGEAQPRLGECKVPPMPRALLLIRLAPWGEQQVRWELLDNGVLLEFWANTKTGTWSILQTLPHGMACVGDAGDGYYPPPRASI
jgi:hypothetical protein